MKTVNAHLHNNQSLHMVNYPFIVLFMSDLLKLNQPNISA